MLDLGIQVEFQVLHIPDLALMCMRMKISLQNIAFKPRGNTAQYLYFVTTDYEKCSNGPWRQRA